MDIIKEQIKHKLPKNAVILTKSEALLTQMSLIANWKPQSEVWSLIHGRGVLGIAASLSAWYINRRFRRILKLRSIGQMLSMITLVPGPAILTTLFHTQIIYDKILLLEMTCPLCLEFRGALIQSFFGLVVPVLTTPLINFAVVGSGAHNMPYAYEFKKVLTIVRQVYKPMIPNIALLCILQALFGGYMTHLQIKSYLRVLNIHYLVEQEKKPSKVYIEK
ncbi:uncharacterized protein LOC116849360 [Odontomachus brunneus]|uniref:uncharacterized protein LOC116849360 n=1 Tax=Odontomachus brunneus TaxID=486640 RepID=UPI0013F1EC95|nr:uncharacterized protein LOC116849360 [Odontomachus brunneus]